MKTVMIAGIVLLMVIVLIPVVSAGTEEPKQASPAHSPVNVTVTLTPSGTHPAPLAAALPHLAPGFAGRVYAAVRSRRRIKNG